jgi:CDP-diacylglycerol--serine O-phosphatidyltransferase
MAFGNPRLDPDSVEAHSEPSVTAGRIRRLRRFPAIAVLPTMFTLANLVCGFFAIVVAARIDKPVTGVLDPMDPTNAMLSAWLIFLAMLFDALDGYVARLSRTASDFGEQLDSLADLVTFGVAPAILLVKICPRFAFLHNEAVWVIAATYAASTALRLARFNVETDENDDHLNFKGLPSPAAAASLAGFAIMFYTLRRESMVHPYAETIDVILQTILPFYALLVAMLMVSRVPYPHIVNQYFRGHRRFGHVVRLMFALVILTLFRGYAVPLVCFLFVIGGPVRYFWQEVVQRRPHDEPFF